MMPSPRNWFPILEIDPPMTIGEAAEAVSFLQAHPSVTDGIKHLHDILTKVTTVRHFAEPIPVVVEAYTNLLFNIHRVMLDYFHYFTDSNVHYSSNVHYTVLNPESVDSLQQKLCDIAEFSRHFRTSRFQLASQCNPASLPPDSQLRADSQVARITYLADQCIGLMITLEQQTIEQPNRFTYSLSMSHRSALETGELRPMENDKIFEEAPSLTLKSSVLWSKLDQVRNSSTLIQKSGNSSCPVCLESRISEDEDFGILDGCWHLFCKKCSLTWLESSAHRTCPLCRKTVEVWTSHESFLHHKRAFAGPVWLLRRWWRCIMAEVARIRGVNARDQIQPHEEY